MPRAFVTGAGGFAGGFLVAALREAGWKVVTHARRGPADVVGDLCRVPLRGVSADVVFHLAGFSNPAKSRQDPGAAFLANAYATARVAREVRAGRFVLASSCKVYGPSARSVDESVPPAPETPYAVSKLWAETLARQARDVVILRPFNHTGPGQSCEYVAPNLCRQVARAEAGGARTVRVVARAPRLDLFDVRDMARAYVRAAEQGRTGAVYNVATGNPVSVGEILKLLASMARAPFRVVGPAGPRTVQSGDAAAFRRETGWSPRIPLSQTLADVLAFERLRAAAGRRAAPG